MKSYKVNIDSKIYEIQEKELNIILELGKNKYKKLKLNVIYALQLNNVIELRNDIYKDISGVKYAAKHWIKQGYKIYYTMF